MQQTPEPLENLIDQFARFPGIGRKGATRMAYEVMSMSNEQAMQLAKAIEAAKTGLHRCRLPGIGIFGLSAAPLSAVPGLYGRRSMPDLLLPQAGPLHHLRGGIPARHQGH